MAYTQVRAGQNQAFFETLRLAAQYCAVLKQIEPIYHDSVAEYYLRFIYYTIITIGPEGSAYADDYKEALNFVRNDTTYCPPYDFLQRFRYARILLNPKSRARNNDFDSIYYRLRGRQGFAPWIRYAIKRNKLYLEAEKTTDLKEIIGKNKQLIKESKKIFGLCLRL